MGKIKAVYTAVLGQSATNEVPVAKVLQNTLNGTPVITIRGLGYYQITLANAFPMHRTIIPPFSDYWGNVGNHIPLIDGAEKKIKGYYTVYPETGNSLTIEVRDADLNWISIFDLFGVLGGLLIKAEVYTA